MEGIGRALGTLITFLAVMCAVFVPLGAWKLIEVMIWVWNNVHWGAK